MQAIIIETVIDAIKTLPFLFGAYLLIEYIEHKSGDKLQKTLAKSGRLGPLLGSILGAVPQCGFSVAATNLYAGRIITVGTLIAVYLSTSDEAIPILLAKPGNADMIFQLILIKIIIGIIGGLVVDLFWQKVTAQNAKEDMDNLCSHCDCEHGILKSAFNHTINIFGFILLISLIFNLLINFIGEANLSKVLMTNSIIQPAIAALIGFIPNCAASAILTSLYIEGTISFGAIIAGLCTSAGIGLLILFKVNNNLKDNFKIVFTLYFIGTISGMIIELFN